MPAVFNPKWEPFARAYYTAESMGVVDKTHQALFDALHRDHLPLRTIDDLANVFYAKYGVNPAKFLSTARSFVIESELAHGAADLRRRRRCDADPGRQRQVSRRPMNGARKIGAG